jgi:hypothetical protein
MTMAEKPGGSERGAGTVSAFDLMRAAPRCGARTRRGTSCMAPAMPNGRCRMHGGKSPGGPIGAANGRYRHGRFTRDAKAARREERATIRMIRYLVSLS